MKHQTHSERSTRAAAYNEADHRSDVANEEDVAEAYENDEEAVTVLGFRLIGEVAVKGSSRLVKLHEVFQADEVQVRKYKHKSKETFEEAVRLQLKKAEARRDSHANRQHGEYNPLRRRSDEDATAAAEQAEIEASRTPGRSEMPDNSMPNVPDALLLIPLHATAEQQKLPAREVSEDDSCATTAAHTGPHRPGASPIGPHAAFGGAFGTDATPRKDHSSPNDDGTILQILDLLDECVKIAEACGVEDPVVAVKRSQVVKGGFDVFNAK